MSRMEPDEFINDRYAAMESRLAVRCCGVGLVCLEYLDMQLSIALIRRRLYASA
jgi:hypothetical protein